MAAPAFTTEHAGVTLAYDVHEPSAAGVAETLLLVMGVNMRSAHWGPHFIDALRAHYRVVTFDNRGTGYSTKPVDTITAALWAGDALAVLDAAGVERAHVLGYSMGGRIAQELAVRHPARVGRLVLMSSVVGGPDAVRATDRAVQSFIPKAGMTPEQMRREGLTITSGPGFPDAQPERFEALVAIGEEKRTPLNVLQKQLGVLGEPTVVEALSTLTTPTRVIHGDADELVPFGNGEALARLIPGAELVRLPGVGHLPTWEAPEPLTRAIIDFLG